jgi:hypothetical protein
LLNKIPNILNTHQNQFGYKYKTSCSHALFAFKETIIHHLENKQHCFAAKLDAVKAFDKLWREALYFKMIKSDFLIDFIIILRIYYDKLVGKIKINEMFSSLFKLKRCVKQGGILSGGALFNFYIDDFIKECAEAGVGAMFIEIVMCILGFCADIS